MNNGKRIGVAAAALLATASIMTVSANAQDNTVKVKKDIARAVSTLDDMQKLGRQIENQHRAELASSVRGRRSSSVRTASQTETNVAKKSAKKRGAKVKKTKKSKKSAE